MTVTQDILTSFVKKNAFIVVTAVVLVILSLSIQIAIIPKQVSKIAAQFPKVKDLKLNFFQNCNKYDTLPFILTTLAVSWLTITVLQYAKQTIFSSIKPKIYKHIKSTITKGIINQKQRNYDTGEAVSRTNRVIDDMTSMSVDSLPMTFPGLMAIVVTNIYVYIQNYKIGLTMTIGIILSFSIIGAKSKKIVNMSINESKKYHQRSEKLNDIIFNHEHIKLNNTSNTKISESKDNDQKYGEALNDVIIESRNTRFVSGIISVLVLFISLWILYRETQVGNFSKENVGALVIVLLLYVSFTQEMVDYLPELMILLGKILDSDSFLGKIVKENNTDIVPLRHIFKTDIKIMNVQLTVGEKVILDNFNLYVPEKTKIGIFGKSGKGKSTLLKAIFNLFEPTKGSIFIGGYNIKEYIPSSFQKSIVYINQDTSLENTTIMKNLQIGNERTEDEIQTFLNKYDLMPVFQNGLKETITMNGKLISKGMQKVIFITRGLLRKDAKIYLIDEPTTSVDALTKAKIIEAIKEVCEGKTVICVSHDDDIKNIMDRSIEL